MQRDACLVEFVVSMFVVFGVDQWFSIEENFGVSGREVKTTDWLTQTAWAQTRLRTISTVCTVVGFWFLSLVALWFVPLLVFCFLQFFYLVYILAHPIVNWIRKRH